MTSVFWGLIIGPGNIISHDFRKPLRVTTACFGEKVAKKSSTCVYLQVNNNEFVLCKLSESNNESQTIDIYLPSGEVSFRVSGPNEVYLTGHSFDEPNSKDKYNGHTDKLSQEYMRIEFEPDSDFSFDENESGASLEEENIEEIEESEDKGSKSKKEAPQTSAKDTKPASKKKAVPTKEANTPVNPSNLTKKQRKASREQQADQESQAEVVKIQEKIILDKLKSDAPKSKSKKNKVNSKKQKVVEAKPTTAKPKIKGHPNGLIVEDKIIGTGAVAKHGDKVSVRYIGKVKNGVVFANNTRGTGYSFKLGAGQVIRGWDLGIEGMKVGGERHFVIPPALGYGEKGAALEIPSDATLEYDIMLLAVK